MWGITVKQGSLEQQFKDLNNNAMDKKPVEEVKTMKQTKEQQSRS